VILDSPISIKRRSMINNYPAIGTHLLYITPLKKWRILSLQELLVKSGYESTYKGFCKLIRRLEKRNLINSFVDPFSRRKYLFLTKEGDSYIGGEENPPSIINETLIHDSKVVEIVLELLKLDSFNRFELEHELKEPNTFASKHRTLPDALLYGEKDNKKFNLAIELELTQKTKSRYLEKVGQYLYSTYYDFVLYFFQSRKVMETYRKNILLKYGEDSVKKIIYVLDEKLFDKNFTMRKSLVIYGEKEGKIDALF
jgi:hypothetical protein